VTESERGGWPRIDEARVTVLIPTYNRSHWLRDAVASVLAQPDPFLLIVSDNASTDDTPAVVAEFSDPRLHYVRRSTNIGLVEHFNWCLEQVDTEFVHVIPDDDAVYPQFLSTCVPVLDRHPNVGVVHTGFDIIDDNDVMLDAGVNLVADVDVVETGAEFIRRSMATLWRIHATTAVVRTKAFRDGGLFRLEDLPGPDFGLWFRVALDWDIAYVARPLVRYRVHGHSYSAALGGFASGRYMNDFDHPTQMLEVKLRFLARYGDRLDDVGRLRTIAVRSRRADLVEKISDMTYPDRPVGRTLRLVADAAHIDRAVLVHSRVYRLVVVALLGPRVARGLRAVRDRLRRIDLPVRDGEAPSVGGGHG
jgi:glycosyltransferase involved in cell wall biosynthesis